MAGDMRIFEQATKELGLALRQRPAARRALLSAAGMILWAGVGFMAAPMAQGQTAAKCPTPNKLKLDQVVNFVKGGEKRALEVFPACQYAFSLDAPSLDTLVHAGLTDAEFHVLNGKTAAQLTLEQAHMEVQGLEAYVSQADPALAGQRDADLQKNDTEYQAARAKAAKIDPKGEFESTANYNLRVKQSQAALADLDTKHEAAVAQIKASYEQKVRARYKPFQERAEFLKQSVFSISTSTAYAGYNADTNRLTATVGGEEYWFDQVPAATAQRMKEGWKSVTVARAYDDDDSNTRVLRLASAQIEVKGKSRLAMEAAAQKARAAEITRRLNEAQTDIDQHDYEGARTSYQSVLAMDPDNQAAKDGIAKVEALKQKQNEAAEARRQKQQAFMQGLEAAGIWLNPSNHQLMWTMKKSQQTLNWGEANNYCQTSTLGGLSGWRLPTLEEIDGIRPKSSRDPYRFGPFDLSGWGIISIWSSTMAGSDAARAESPAGISAHPLSYHAGMYAACVRQFRPESDGLDSSQADAKEQKQREFLQGLQAAGVWLDPSTQLMWTAKDSEHVVNFQAAEAYCQALQLGGMKSWRLPTIGELRGLWDPNNTRVDLLTNILERSFPFHIKLNIQLHNPLIWSSDQAGNGAAYLFDFQNGQEVGDRVNSKETRENGMLVAHHALCVRAYQPDDGLSAPPPAGATQNAPQTQPANGPESSASTPQLDPAEITRRATALYESKHFVEAAPLYDQTCAAGNIYDCDRLGFMYMNGLGVTKDTARAELLETKACDGGNPYGCGNLGFLEQTVEQDYAKAFQHYSKACNARHARSCSNLGFLHEGGKGVPVDIGKAKSFYSKGCSLGDQWGCEQNKRLQ